jgi:hypothetical protein
MGEASNIRIIRFTVEGKDFSINLPTQLYLRAKQNPDCNAEQHLCGLFNGQKCCLKINLGEDNGNLSVFDMTPCSHHPDKRGLRI